MLMHEEALHTCPLSKFSFSSSRLLAPPVRRITLGIALGTCCMELFTRSILVCFSQQRKKERKKKQQQQQEQQQQQLSADKQAGPQNKKNEIKKIKAALTMAGSGPCCAGLVAPFTGSSGLSVHHPVNDRSSLNGSTVKCARLRGGGRFRFHFSK